MTCRKFYSSNVFYLFIQGLYLLYKDRYWLYNNTNLGRINKKPWMNKFLWMSKYSIRNVFPMSYSVAMEPIWAMKNDHKLSKSQSFTQNWSQLCIQMLLSITCVYYKYLGTKGWDLSTLMTCRLPPPPLKKSRLHFFGRNCCAKFWNG